MTIIHEYCEANEGAKLEDFMQSVSLVSDTDEDEAGEYVTLATVHGVKGLELHPRSPHNTHVLLS